MEFSINCDARVKELPDIVNVFPVDVATVYMFPTSSGWELCVKRIVCPGTSDAFGTVI